MNQTKAILQDNGGRRSGIDRRQFSYDAYIPERRWDVNQRSGEDQRSGKDRRSGADRRKKQKNRIRLLSYILNCQRAEAES